MSDIIAEYVITNELGDDTALIFPDDSSSGGGGGSPQTPPASFGPDIATPIVGTIGGAQWGSSISRGGAFACDSGLLTVPLPDDAEYSSGTITTSSPGLIGGVDFSKTDTTSEINAGFIKLAAANASSHCDGTTDGTPGGIYGVGYSSSDSFEISKGYVRIPRPNGYTFDPQWFDVVNGQVTLKEAALEDVINELVDELAVNIDVTTDLEHVNVIQGEKIIRATSDATLTLDTLVKSVNA